MAQQPSTDNSQRILQALRDARTKLEAAERSKHEPIAIVGMACRFPAGADTPEKFWQLLRDGVDAVTEIPASRWPADKFYDPDPAAPGKTYMRYGAFLTEPLDQFDAQLFEISPKEVQSMDPQQRLLLEVSWEALENAGLMPTRHSGSPTGVFVGITTNDYGRRISPSHNLNEISAYYMAGNHLNAAAGRLSYVLGLQGPSMAIDTACSSSLVAVHLAVQSLRSGECEQALVGGVNLILSPETAIALSKARMASPDGRCKTFDASADGFGAGEGCGVVILKRLSEAQADGDNILGLIRGTAVNNDGPSSGFTVPNGQAQQALIRQALANGKVEPQQISYIEAHGTGTSLGDPLEVQALAGVFADGRTAADPLLLGSVKTNIGHLTAAAGVAGLLKLILSLQHGELPPHLHYHTPNPHIPWAKLPVQVVTQTRPWTGERVAGVSSFGASGTNAHVVVQAAPPAVVAPVQPERTHHVLTLSAQTPAALEALIQRYEEHFVQYPQQAVADICFTANTGRAQLAHRAYFVLEKEGEALALRKAEASHPAKNHQPAQIAFLFTGQGSQYAGMGHTLYETQPSFRATVDQCAEFLKDHLECDLREVMWGDKSASLNSTIYTQPALFVLEYALAQLWLSWGVRPDVVIGHSVGEITAACIAGLFSLGDGLKLIAARANLMQALPAGGGMTAVLADEQTVLNKLALYHGRVTIAAVNGPQNSVISGEQSGVDSIAQLLERDGVTTIPLTVSHAFHSPLMEPMLEAFRQVAETIGYHPPQMRLISNVTGRLAGSEVQTAAYWVNHVRDCVRFAAGMTTLDELGINTFVEIGPQPTLLGMGRKCWPAHEEGWLPSLRRNSDDWATMLDSLGQLYVRGVEVDWSGFEGDYRPQRRRIPLPTYPFQRQRYWIETPSPLQTVSPNLEDGHPLLGCRLELPGAAEQRYQTVLGADQTVYLQDHQVFGEPMVPSAVYVEMALAAGHHYFGDNHLIIRHLVTEQPLRLSKPRLVQFVLTPQGETATFAVYSKSEGEWVRQAHGQLQAAAQLPEPTTDLTVQQALLTQESQAADSYAAFRERGINFGERFARLQKVWRGAGEALGRIQLGESEIAGYHLHPIVLDAALHTLGALFGADNQQAYMQVGLDELTFYRQAPSEVWSYVRLLPGDTAEAVQAEATLFTAAGEVVALLKGLHLQQVQVGAQQAPADWFHEVVWRSLGSELISTGAWPSPPELEQQVAVPQLGEIDDYANALPKLEQLSTLYTWQALQNLGWQPKVGRPFTTAALSNDLHISAEHQRLFSRLLAILGEANILQSEGADRWLLKQAPGDAIAEVQAELAERPVVAAELALLNRCGAKLAEVLNGTQDPLQLLFPEGDLASAARLYRDSLGAQVMNQLMVQAVTAALACFPAGKSLRVLEIGAGTGGTTSYIAPLFPAERTRYTFTDISPIFTAEAEENFAAYPFIDYAVLDISQDPAAQGFENGRYDLIVAANVLHATPELAQTMAHVRQLLAPNGLLLMLEGTERQKWVDLIFGLTSGWWNFTDTKLRPEHLLLTPAQWQENLREWGFGETAAVDVHEPFRQALIIAQATSEEQWLIVGEQSGLAEQIKQRLPEEHVVVVGEIGSTAEGEELLRRLPQAPSKIVHLASVSTAENSQAATASALYLTQALIRANRQPAALWFVTQGAQGDGVTHPAQATLWGLGKTIQLEHPELHGRLLDLGANASVEAVLAVLGTETGAQQLLLRGEKVLTAELQRAQIPAGQPELTCEATYLVTGGLRGIGLEVARWLVTRGARYLVLVARSRPTAETEAVLQTLRESGATIVVRQTDVAQKAALAAVLAEMEQSMPPLRGVFHAAGVYADRLVKDHEWSLFEEVFAPKVRGGWHLHELTAEMELDYFVLFSAAASLLGGAGLANYTAANAYLDALAHYRRGRGLPAVAINWGPWKDVGMASEVGARREAQWALGGIRPMQPTLALAALGQVMGGEKAQVGVVALASKPSGLSKQAKERINSKSVAIREELEKITDKAKALRLLKKHIREQVAQVMGFASPEMVEDEQGFFQMGMDSLMAMDLRNKLQESLACTLPPTLTFKYPDINSLVEFLAREIVPAAAEATPDMPAVNGYHDPITQEVQAMEEDELARLVDDELARLLGGG